MFPANIRVAPNSDKLLAHERAMPVVRPVQVKGMVMFQKVCQGDLPNVQERSSRSLSMAPKDILAERM